ncbi:hypothetical protein GPECTOR_3g335 [Gonium pectorale]|uniref:ribonuclease Z n=1 Tax=Gonium pectorale TaxID=33097 RepID=A0A150H0V1_GONPE|nr:hypothetical protein GPECTOR_3g335 [Gonium pectorale]|eukprot:KXZ55190.1 hypothetical protein GPECTOR_3g335 [Gonium pectorale]
MAKKKGQDAPAAQPKQDGKQKQKGQQPQRQPQQQRSEQRAGGMQHYSSFLQVLAVDIDHTSPSVLLFFDKERYLFNAGEGIQRLFREHKIKIKQVTAYFVTRVSTETLGGLPGMALSVVPADAGGLLGRQAACTVKGPRGLADYVASFRSYINQENTVAVGEIDAASTQPLLKTDVVTITPIMLTVRPPSSSNGEGVMDVEAEEAEAAAGGGNSPAAKRRRTDGAAAQQSRPGAGEQSDGETDADAEGRQRPAGPSCPRPLAVYTVQLAGRPGKFMPDKARALGVTPGPLFGELQRGHSVTTDDGRTVAPADVMEAAVPGPSLLILDTPSVEALEAVAADERVRRFAAEAAGGGADAELRTCVAVHMLPDHLASDDGALAPLRAALGPAWRHVLVCSGPQQPSALPRASAFQAKLHAIHPGAFPLFALGNSHAPPALPEGAKPAAAAAAAAGSPASAVAPAEESGKGKAQGGKGGGGGAAPAATAAGGLPLLAAQQWPSLPLPPGGCVAAQSAVRLNLMPPARQGLEYVDVFEYDSSSKVLEDLRSNPDYAEVLAAAAAARDGGEEQPAAPAARSLEGAAPAPAAAEERPTSTDADMAEAGPPEAAERPPSAPAEAVPGCIASGDRQLAELTFLGTASSQPSKYRNVSGCYVDLFARGGLLVDCGEDAMGQMKRRFGREDAERRLLQLRLVWVSHMHADHHGGLYRLLEWRAARGAPPLLIVGPRKLFDVLVRYSAAVPVRGFVFLANAALVAGAAGGDGGGGGGGGGPLPPAACVAAFRAAVAALGLRSCAPFPVEHIWDAHGLRLEGEAGWSVVFSGDTRPCAQTVAAARGATLLVHEATFEESMHAEARAKKHSTTAEAVSVGERAGAYRTLLTHFSTRYPTLPELDLSPHPSVGVAMDLMSLNLADLPWLPRLVRPLGLLFKRLEEDKVAEADDDE